MMGVEEGKVLGGQGPLRHQEMQENVCLGSLGFESQLSSWSPFFSP